VKRTGVALLVFLVGLQCRPALAEDALSSPSEQKQVDSNLLLKPQTPSMAPIAVPTSEAPPTAAGGQARVEANVRPPLQGHLAQHTLGVRSLPEGRDPDYIIGHFAIGFGPFIHFQTNGPLGNMAELSKKFVKKWQGKQVNPCLLKLVKLQDNSGGYYFKTRSSKDGPCGWLMPMPKRPGKDKVTPWAIYFDQ